MIHTLAERAASVFSSRGVIRESDKDIYAYGCELILSAVLNTIISIAVSMLFGMVIEGLAFVLSFVLLRRFTGGHHAKSHLLCIVSFACILSSALAVLWFVPTGTYVWIAIVSSVVFFITVFCFAPVGHVNKVNSENSIVALRVKGRLVGLAVGCLNIVVAFLLNVTAFQAVSLALFAVSVSMLYAVYLKSKEECVK